VGVTTGLAQLGAACSTAHLKLKYHAKDGIIASLNGDSEAAKRYFLQENKSHSSVSNPTNLLRTKGKLLRASRMQTWSNWTLGTQRKT